MRRAAALLLGLAVLVAVVAAWPRSPDAGSTGDATARDADLVVAPHLETSPNRPKAAVAVGPGTGPPVSPASTPYRFEVRGDGGPLADATIEMAEGALLGKTDAEGRLSASVSAPESWASVGVIARHAGYAPTYATAQREEVCRITMERGATLHGRVVLAPGDVPVEGARVVSSIPGRTRVSLGETVTDGAGRFQVNDAPRGVSVELVVRAAGHATATAEGKTEEEVVIRFEEGGILEGVVSNAEGKPIPGAAVCILRPQDPLPPDWMRGTAWQSDWSAVDAFDRTTTDATGRYEISGLKTNKPLVAVALPTPMLFGRSETATFERVGERLRRDVIVPAPGALQVVVEGVTPTEGAEVLLNLRGGGLDVQARAAQRLPTGFWEFPSLTPGRYEVRFFTMGSPFIGRYTEVESGKTSEVHLSFPGTKTIEGRVTTEDGTVVPQATVWWMGGTRAVSTTDGEGRFRLSGLDETPGTLIAGPLEQNSAAPLGRTVMEQVMPGASGPVHLVLGRHAKVRIQLPGLAPGTSVEALIHARFGSFNGRDHFVTAGGTLDVPVQILGAPLEIVLRIADSTPLRFDVAPLAGGETRDLGEMRFEPGRSILVRVLGADDTPVISASLVGDDEWGSRAYATNAQGEADLRHMPSAAFHVGVTAANRPPFVFTVPAETKGPVVLRLESEGTLELRVTERDGAPASAAQITLLTAEEDPYEREHDAFTRSEKADAAGIWRARVQPRMYRLTIRSLTGGGEARRIVTVRSGETTTVAVRLP